MNESHTFPPVLWCVDLGVDSRPLLFLVVTLTKCCQGHSQVHILSHMCGASGWHDTSSFPRYSQTFLQRSNGLRVPLLRNRTYKFLFFPSLSLEMLEGRTAQREAALKVCWAVTEAGRGNGLDGEERRGRPQMHPCGDLWTRQGAGFFSEPNIPIVALLCVSWYPTVSSRPLAWLAEKWSVKNREFWYVLQLC